VKMDPHRADPDVLKYVRMEPLQCVLTVIHLLDLLEDHLRVLTAPHLPVMMAPHLCVLMVVLQTPLLAVPAQEDGLNVLMDPGLLLVMTVVVQVVQEVKEVQEVDANPSVPMEKNLPVQMDPHLGDVLKCVTMTTLQCVLTVTHPLNHLRVLTAPHLHVTVPLSCVLMAVLQTPLATLPVQEESLNVLMDPPFLFAMTVAGQDHVVQEEVVQVVRVKEADPNVLTAPHLPVTVPHPCVLMAVL